MGGEGKMGSGMGMSPRKAMAGGASSGNFGVSEYPGRSGVKHSDMSARTGEKGAMSDGERGVGMPVGGSKGMHPAQGAPDHGPSMDNWSRSGKA